VTDDFSSVLDVYREQGVGLGSVGFGDASALLIVDLQHMYTRGPRGTGLEAVAATRRVLDEARDLGLPIYHTYVGYPAGAVDAGVWGMKCPGLRENVRGTQACALDPMVEPLDGETVIEKRAPSAFFDTGLADMLRQRGVDTVVVCGTSTSGCVRASVVDGVSHGFRMIVPEECVSDRSEPSHAAALFDMGSKYGDVVTIEQALEGIRATAVRSGASSR